MDPFRFESGDLRTSDLAVRRILADFKVSSIVFDCDIGLQNRRVVSFQEPSEAETLPDADKSHPERLSATWTYFHNIEWRQFTVPVPYKIELTYATNPRQDLVGAMTFAAAPEQIVLLQIQGTRRLIQSLNDELDGIVKTTFLPLWWRLPKRALQTMEPYLGFAIYGAAITTIFVGFNNFEKWTGRPLLSDKTDEQLKKEILKDREDYFSRPCRKPRARVDPSECA